MSAKRKVFDIEIERARRALDGPVAYPGEPIESVIIGLQSDVHRIVTSTRDALVELRSLCRRIDARVAELLALGR
jgi:hypothetical protein